MKRSVALLLCLQWLLWPGALAATGADEGDYPSRVVSHERWIEEWDSSTQRWVRITDIQSAQPADHNSRRASKHRDFKHASILAQYGPFQIVDRHRARMVGATGPNAVREFRAMLRDFPDVEILEFIEAPGTTHDLANLEVGRLIRAAGIRTHVPMGGSVRSGAVELFLAGDERTIASGAQFAVHSWRDSSGREPNDFPADAAENRLYLDYYVEMGMSEARAYAFYSMTNSVAHDSAIWLGSNEMLRWISVDNEPSLEGGRIEQPLIAYDSVVHSLAAFEAG